jgi:two-component system, NtrC family, sensor kinase
VRTVLAVPLLKEDALVGELVLNRQEVRPFTEKQLALVQNFASQAVIAIESTRLLNELHESLQEQTVHRPARRTAARTDCEPVGRILLRS